MSQPVKNTIRFDFIDLLKGFGIFLVVWGHTMTPRSIYIYSFHMPLFFFLSGFVHKERQKPFKEYFFAKLNTLYVPYAAFSLFSWVFYLVRYWSRGQAGALFGTHWPKLLSIFTGTADNGGNNPIWFLACIFVISLIFGVLNRFVVSSRLKWGLILMSSLLGYYLSVKDISVGFFQLDVAFTGLVFYGLGYAVKQSRLLSRLDDLKTWRLAVLIILAELVHISTAYANVALSSISWVNLAGNTIGNYPLFYLSALAGIAVFTAIAYKLGLVRFLNQLGMQTLIILGIHKPTLLILNLTLGAQVNNKTWLYGFAAAIVAILFSLLVGGLLNKYCPVLVGKRPLFSRKAVD